MKKFGGSSKNSKNYERIWRVRRKPEKIRKNPENSEGTRENPKIILENPKQSEKNPYESEALREFERMSKNT